MDRFNGKEKVGRAIIGVFFLLCITRCFAGNIKFVDVPLDQIIELYSRETGQNVFVDESVQRNRRVNAQLQGMPIRTAFDLIQKTLNLESCMIGTATLVLFPPEKASRYRPGMKSVVMKIPLGLDMKWVTGIINALMPNLKTALAPADNKALILFGPGLQITEAGELAKQFPKITPVSRRYSMTESEAILAVLEFKESNITVQSDKQGLTANGKGQDIEEFQEKLCSWRKRINWGKDIFSSETIDMQKIFKAAEAIKGRANITDLGGTGAILIEGPVEDREKVIQVLQTLEEITKPYRKEVILGELKADTVKEALKAQSVNIEKFGDRQLVLSGRKAAVENAVQLLKNLDKKRSQVLIRFRLAEISKSKMKTLGIDLDKSAYSYGEIKGFHGQDTLPILLKVLDENKDAHILAEPNLRVLEGEEAKVIIGDRIPLEVAATAQTDSGSTLKLQTQLNWVDVGIKMTVKNVAVALDGGIRMSIRNEVSSVVSTTKQGYPQIRTREAESILRVCDGDSVLMGGLLSKEDRENRNGIPWLSKLPLVGGFARSRDKTKTETEIVMIITAKVAKD